MPTGFDKFSKRALEEEGISINNRRGAATAAAVPEKPEEKAVAKLSRAVKIEEPAQPEEKKKLFPLTIQIEIETKRKLDELKFTQEKKLKDLAEEAFADLYAKYHR